MDKVVDAVEEFAASRILGPDGRPYVKNGFSRERLDLTDVEYMSAQRIGELVESPKHYEWKYIKGNRPKDTPAKQFGKLVHWALLQPKEFLSRYVIEQKFEGEGSRKAKKEWLEALPKNTILVTREDAKEISDMIQALHSHPRASKLLSKGTPEVHTFYADHELKDEHGRPFLWYGIMDFYRSGNWIVEVKTTRSARWWNFAKDSYDFGYHLQTWKYRRMVQGITGKKPDTAIIAIENVAPYCVEVFEPTDRWMEHANYEVTLALESFKECRQSGIWHSYNKDPMPISLPPWTKSRFDDGEEK